MPQVSVIVPNYNHALYLKQRIDSVLNQTFQDFELIILDDFSTDDSKNIIEQYRNHPKVSHIICNELNSGTTFKQWKKGIELAIGEFIWIAESDDWCEPDLLRTLVNGLEYNKGCVMAYAQTYVIKNDHILKTSSHAKLSEYINGKKYIARYLTGSCTIWNASMMVFKKKNYLNISNRFTTFTMCGDWLFYIEMASQGDVFVSGRLLNYFRNHDNHVSTKMYKSGNNYLEELKILKILKKGLFITEKEYKQQLLSKFIQFTVFKYKYSDATVKELLSSFYFNENTSFKWFLKFNGTIDLFKIKLRRRLNLILK